jgi:ferric-dicitrate binding protein FerR (iron transport regulator)
MREHKQIYDLVEKFLEGRTSNAEERELYAWFRENEVPAEWQELKAMFEWYEAGMPEINNAHSDQLSEQPTPVTQHTVTSRPRRRVRMWLTGAAITAAASIAALLWLTPTTPAIDIYEGSYIIEAGVMCDNSESIRQDIEELLARAELIEQSADELIAWADI